MAGRTPGPWRVREEPRFDALDRETISVEPAVDKPTDTWADTSIMSTGVGIYEERYQRVRADARLIAAAPELLAALEALLDAVSDLPDDAREAWPEETVVRAFAALDKARGPALPAERAT